MRFAFRLSRSWSIVDLRLSMLPKITSSKNEHPSISIPIRSHSSFVGAVNVFDRNAKRRQRNRASMSENPSVYDYLKDAVAANIVDRVRDVARFSL